MVIKRSHLLLLFCLGFMLSTACGAAEECVAIVDKFRSAVVYIHVKKTADDTGAVSGFDGTGFIVSKEGYVFTSKGLFSELGDPTNLKIFGAPASRAAEQKPMDYLTSNDFGDVAVLKFTDSSITWRPVALGNPFGTDIGRALCSMSFPRDIEFSLRRGTLSGKNAPHGWWFSDIPSDPGDDGAPVFDATDGKLLGSVRMFPKKATKPSQLNYLVPINLANPMLSTYAGLEVKRDAARDLVAALQSTGAHGSAAADLAQNADGSNNNTPGVSQESIQQQSVTILDSLWRTPKINVCWENPLQNYRKEMSWVRQEVSDTWERASQLRFLGWQQCATENRGLRIEIDDNRTNKNYFFGYTKGIGRHLDGVPNGIVINFNDCADNREICVKGIAGHVFGHAIGLRHTQERGDAPADCRQKYHTTESWSTTLTPYDPYSIMNYCNPIFNNAGKLSDLDILLVQKLYGKN